MAWKSRVQKKSSWNSAPQQKSMFKPRGWSKRVEDSADVSQSPTQPVQRRGFDLNTLRIFPDTPSPVQAKLTVGAPGDKYEQEADAMASQVMSMPESAVQREMTPEETEEEVQTKPLAAGITPLVQREAMPEQEEQVQTKLLGNATIQREAMPEEEEIQTKPLNASIQREILPEEEVQTKPVLQRANDGSFQAGGNIESRLNSSKGEGSPLPDEVRSFMEPRFGTDFSQVRVHTDGEAVQMNRELGAQAFAHGSDIYFGAGKSPGNNELTAHELTHVVQQTGRVQTKQDFKQSTLQLKCSACENEKAEEQRYLHSSATSKLLVQQHTNSSHIQRVHIEEKKFKCKDFDGNAKLEACLNNRDRLRPGDKDKETVQIVQEAIEKYAGISTAPDTKGVYGQATSRAVKEFKKKYGLGFESFPDVGPGTMKKLDELCTKTTPTPSVEPPIPSSAPPFPSKIDFWLNAFIPNTLSGVRLAPGGPFAGRTVFPSPPIPYRTPKFPFLDFRSNSCFETDDRSFDPSPTASSRVGIMAQVDTVSGAITFIPNKGLTFEIDCDTGSRKCAEWPTPTVTASKLFGSKLNFFISGTGNDPCVKGAPDLAFRGVVTIDKTSRTLTFNGATSLFPAFEMYSSSGGSIAKVFNKSPRGNTPLLLLVPGVDPVSATVPI